MTNTIKTHHQKTKNTLTDQQTDDRSLSNKIRPNNTIQSHDNVVMLNEHINKKHAGENEINQDVYYVETRLNAYKKIASTQQAILDDFSDFKS
jgi:hypothetical protein